MKLRKLLAITAITAMTIVSAVGCGNSDKKEDGKKKRDGFFFI